MGLRFFPITTIRSSGVPAEWLRRNIRPKFGFDLWDRLEWISLHDAFSFTATIASIQVIRPTVFTLLLISIASHAGGADHFLTIGGGYSREGNQASLEANVRFLQEVLMEEYTTPPMHTIYFADGRDKGADLQVAVNVPELTAGQLLASLHRSRGGLVNPVKYRNHQVSGIAGSTKPDNISAGLKEFAVRLTSGDRLFVYVTAHGSSAKGDNKYNTSIACWDRKSISAKQLSRMLDALPRDVPVILVMAQCYCGGFAHAIFDDADSDEGLSRHLRTGFFAQQHDLPAAGCRPDIDNDEEYSSFFWGALVGRSRNGKPVEKADLNKDGVISFAEAHAHAVLDSNTIDIPLRASEALLREFSRMTPAESSGKDDSNGRSKRQNPDQMIDKLRSAPGTISDLAATARPDVQSLIAGLVTRLGMTMDLTLRDVVDAYQDHRQAFQSARRDNMRGRRNSEARSQLREEIFFVWPELADKDHWRDSELLNRKNRDGLLADIKLMPSYAAYEAALKQRQQASDVAETAELSQIKFRRLVETLVSAALANNLADVASAHIVDRYQQMLEIEESGFVH